MTRAPGSEPDSATTAPCLAGQGKARLSFGDIDQRYALKLRPLIDLCMPSMFGGLERAYDMNSLRADGVIPIIFFVDMEAQPRPLAWFARLAVDYRVYLRRAPGEAGRPDKLILDMQADVTGEEGSDDPKALGSGGTTGRMVTAGRLRALQVLTRPVAPPDARQVTEVPAPLRALAETPWDEPFPTPELLHEAPPGVAAAEAGPWREHRSVWALHNTDINQHVNVIEYIMAVENHCARMTAGAGVAMARHRTQRARLLFRKPFFMGDAHGVQGRLYVADGRTLWTGGVHPVDPEGALTPRPSVAARLEGAISEPG